MPSSKNETAAAEMTAFAAGAGPPENIMPTLLMGALIEALLILDCVLLVPEAHLNVKRF